MACRDFRTIAKEDALRKAACMGDATDAERLAALLARCATASARFEKYFGYSRDGNTTRINQGRDVLNEALDE